MKIFVTGGDGFIGSHLVERLVREGHEVVAMVCYNSFGSWGWLDHCCDEVKGRFTVVAGDIRDAVFVENEMENCEAIFHLAALIGIPYSYSAASSYIETNVRGSLNVMHAAKRQDCTQVIHTSTSEVYGTAQFVPMDESHPLKPQSPYAASKVGADSIAMSFHYSFGTPITIIRPFNTFGPRQSARAIIPTIISQIVNCSEEITLGRLTPVRDFCFVDDIVSGFVAALGADRAIGEEINLGSGYGVSIGELVDRIKEVMGVQTKVVQASERIRPDNSEVERLVANNEKARNILGWSPDYAGVEGLKRGLEKTTTWFNDTDNINKYKSNIYNL